VSAPPLVDPGAAADETRALRGEAALLAEFRDRGQPGVTARVYLESIRAELYQRHLAGASGTEIVVAWTQAMDDLVRALFHYADDGSGGVRRLPRLNQRVAIVARGGYGRGELNVQSDVDLLFLHDWKPGPYLEIVAETIIHSLWDAGLTVGNATRNVRECVKMAADDLKEKTAIIDSRFLAGDEQLWAELDKAMVSEALNRNQLKFFNAKLEETRERHRKYGDSVYLLEPQLKEGEGGLRDLHTALWLAKVKYKIHSLDELVHKAIITEDERDEVSNARDFLWRVRNALHFASGRHHDQLTFEFQERIAPMLGFGEGTAATDRLMHAYYQAASTILRFSEGLIARAIEGPEPGRFFRRAAPRKIRPGVVIHQQLLGIADPDLFKREPLNLLSVFADCEAHGVGLSGAAYQAVRDHVGLIDEKMRRDPRVGNELMRILSAPAHVAETLEAMHLAGVLGAVIPEFGNLYARVLHDLYHIYTVDRHSLVAVRELEKLRAGEFKQANALLTEVARELDSIPFVYLALVLHDIGKGQGHDHDERGAALTAEVCRRLGLNGEQTDLVVFLVRNHLLMSQVAQKGDIDDDSTVADFVRIAGSIDRLKALLLLTFADMRAVAPNVYNNWRDMLLSELYMRALKMLEQGDREAVDPARRLATVKAAVAAQLAAAGAPEPAVAEFLQLMPDRYFLITPEGDFALHFDLMRALGERVPVCRHRHFREREFSEFVVVTRDQPGLFSKIAGVLTANNLNILSARITTRKDGIVMDVFRVSHGRGGIALEDERWRRVDADLERVISGEVEIEQLVEAAHVAQSSGRKFVRRFATEVTVDNRSSEQYTVVDVFTQDRVGLLFAITHALFKLGLLIHLARISTNADQALDVFYVSDRDDQKLTDLDRMRELRAALIAKLEENPKPEENPAMERAPA
jgi:[protein-PII] uridylyltransferase